MTVFESADGRSPSPVFEGCFDFVKRHTFSSCEGGVGAAITSKEELH
jgi:hypothetical protein